MYIDIEPLEPVLWFSRIEKLLSRRFAVDGEAPDALLRQAFHLAQLAPRPLREFVKIALPEETLEELLECGAYASAILMIVSPPASYRLEQNQAGRIAAAVWCGDTKSIGEDEASTIEKALLGSWCQWLLKLRDNSAPLNHPRRHKSRSGPPPKPTSH